MFTLRFTMFRWSEVYHVKMGIDEVYSIYNELYHVNDYYYDIQFLINHAISKTVLHLVAVCITSQIHSKHMLKVCRKFSKNI